MPIESIAAVVGGLPNRMERSDVDRAMARLGEIARAPGYLLAIYDPTTDDPSQLVLASGYPDEWVVRYATQRYDKVDPTLRYLARVDRPYRWEEAFARMEIEDDRRALEVVKGARDLDYGDGWTFPISCRRGRVGGAVFGGPGPYDWSPPLVSALWGAANTIWWRLHGDRPDALPHATRREREVLSLLADGLVSRAIGERMDIAATTVDWHISQLSLKLGARNRQHLVALAMRSGLVA